MAHARKGVAHARKGVALAREGWGQTRQRDDLKLKGNDGAMGK
jgi:hypothetical protein